MREALLHYSEKENPKCYFQVVSLKWEVKMNPGAGLEAAIFMSIWEKVLLLPSKSNVSSCRSWDAFFAKSWDDFKNFSSPQYNEKYTH